MDSSLSKLHEFSPEIAGKVDAAIKEHKDQRVELADGSKQRRHPRVTGVKSWSVQHDGTNTKASVTLSAEADPMSDEEDPSDRSTHLDIPLD